MEPSRTVNMSATTEATLEETASDYAAFATVDMDKEVSYFFENLLNLKFSLLLLNKQYFVFFFLYDKRDSIEHTILLYQLFNRKTEKNFGTTAIFEFPAKITKKYIRLKSLTYS